MILSVEIKNFKRIENIRFQLDNTVVLIGPNNSGKTTILQAIMLWKTGLEKLREQSGSKTKRVGVAINRKDLISLPISTAKFIWFNQNVRASKKETKGSENVRIEIIVKGETKNQNWEAPLEFDFTNSETIYCRPLRKNKNGSEFFEINKLAYEENISFLQPMSGISTIEDKLSLGSIYSRIGEGKTADVLRNICYQLLYPDNTDTNSVKNEKNWSYLTNTLFTKFGIKIKKPIFNPNSGKIDMSYIENGNELDISSSGRGFQQTLLLLSFVLSFENCVLLLDEPDAHLEVIRQREIYELLKKFTLENKTQLIIATHSEIVLNEASELDKVIAIYDNKVDELNDLKDKNQFKKLLTSIGWDRYFIAKTKNQVLYLEGVSDLRMIKSFAEKLGKTNLLNLIDKANIHYVNNNLPKDAREHFYDLKKLIPSLKGFAIFDKIDKNLDESELLKIYCWKKRELENYFCYPKVLIKWAENQGEISLFENNREAMENSIKLNTTPANLENLTSNWWLNTKMSDDYLPTIFEEYFNIIDKPNYFYKKNFYELINYIDIDDIDQEIINVLELIEENLKN